MPVYKAKILNKEINLSYQIDQKDKLVKALNTINEKLKKYDYLNGKISDYQILALLSIELQDNIFEILEMKENDNNIQNKLKFIQNENIKLNDTNIDLNKKNQNFQNEEKFINEEIKEIKNEFKEILNLIKKTYD